MFKVGDIITYQFFKGVKIVVEDENHFILEDKFQNQKQVYKSLVEKYGKYES